MPNSAAACFSVTPLLAAIFLISIFMVPIVNKVFTFVKDFFRMPTDKKIKATMKRQVIKFIEEFLQALNSPQTIANTMQKKFPNEEITRQYIESQFRQPSLTFVLWLEDEYKLNLEWVLKGEKDKTISMLKP